MKKLNKKFIIPLLLLPITFFSIHGGQGELPGELSAEAILNGEYLWPDSPKIEISKVDNGFNPNAFGTVPEPGVHPRILFSPEDLPGIRERIKNTDLGKKAYANLVKRNDISRKEGTAFSNVYKALVEGNQHKAKELLKNYKKAGTSDGTSWHHRPNFAYIMMLESFRALIDNDKKRGKELAKAITTLAKVYQSNMDAIDEVFVKGLQADEGYPLKGNAHLNSDSWRSLRRNAIGGGNSEPLLGYMYDFAYNWMNEDQQSICRNTINNYIRGKTTMGSHMPHHFRNWNWIAIGSGGLLGMSLATEGEEGNDARVYEHTKEIQTDYIKYGWSKMGSSREAVGYTQFGLKWGGPAMVAMARRGHNMWNWERWYNSMKWYAQSIQPGGGRFMSHGDGGHGGVSIPTALLFKNCYPDNPLIDYVLQETLNYHNKGDDKIDGGRGYVMLQCLFAADPSTTDHDMGKNVEELDLTFFDPERNSLITRSEFGKNETQLQFECRADPVADNHQHADRGNFTLSGAGRVWGVDRFRGVESRHHNLVTINGAGQGYTSPPGKWLGLQDNKYATFGACDMKYAYDWKWDGTISGFADKDVPRRNFKRWERFAKAADKFMKDNPLFDWEKNLDRGEYVEKYYNGFEAGDPRMWDEYRRPVRLEHNPVEKAFRTAGLVRGKHSYAIIVDDIKKDNNHHNYEWLMMVDDKTQVIRMKTDEIVLGDLTESVKRSFGTHVAKPKKGDSQLCVKVLERAIPENIFNNPQIRLETFEYKDARNWPNGRSFGLAKRLVVPSYSVEPNFKMLLFPHYHGDELPNTTWNEDQSIVTIQWSDQTDTIEFLKNKEGRTITTITRDGKVISKI